MTTHDLKTWPGPFAAVLDGTKTYEIRKDDRPFTVGDRLHLREWDPEPNRDSITKDNYERTWGVPVGYTGREILVEVTYITFGGQWGMMPGLCVMAIRKVEA